MGPTFDLFVIIVILLAIALLYIAVFIGCILYIWLREVIKRLIEFVKRFDKIKEEKQSYKSDVVELQPSLKDNSHTIKSKKILKTKVINKLSIEKSQHLSESESPTISNRQTVKPRRLNNSDMEKSKYPLKPKPQKVKIIRSVKTKEINPYGLVNEKLICPHCLIMGEVRTKTIKLVNELDQAKSINYPKTLDLSKRKSYKSLHCDYCKKDWYK